MSYAYLASPYSHPDPEVRERRYNAAKIAVKYLLSLRIWVYSPIVHCHVLAVEEGVPFSFNAWEEYDFAMLRRADRLLILRMEGTEESKGIAAERVEAERLMIPWGYL